jgi:CRISPR-associated protein Csd2
MNKIDYMVVLEVNNANPNGDMNSGNMPRVDINNIGEISDVCLKRKMRNRLEADGENILIQMDSPEQSIKDIMDKSSIDFSKSKQEIQDNSCKEWFDVRAFGGVFAFKKSKKNDSVSVNVRGAMSVSPAFSIDPVEIETSTITKCISGESTDSGKRSSDTVGEKHRVKHGIYTFHGSISSAIADKNGLSTGDVECIKEMLPKLFEDDFSASRPAGSMEVLKVLWWEHKSTGGSCSTGKLVKHVTVNSDGSIDIDPNITISPEIIDGF